jgi:hypothetical protein
MSITRTLVAALAVAALAAPAAQAVPADYPDGHAQTARTADRPQTRTADLYQPIPQAQAKRAVNAPGATAADSASVRTEGKRPDTVGGIPKQPAGPVWPTNPKPIVTVAHEPADDTGGGLDAAPLGIGIALALVAIGGIAAVTLRRRVQRLPA